MTTVFCRDCKHCIPSTIAPRYATCDLYARLPDGEYLATGEGDRTVYHYCSIIRQSDDACPTLPDRCGISGKHYEPTKWAA